MFLCASRVYANLFLCISSERVRVLYQLDGLLFRCGPPVTGRRILIFLAFVKDIERRLGHMFWYSIDKFLEVVSFLLR